MPSKIQLDENLWFLYICLQKSDLKSIDFAAVGHATSLKPPAARMRYTRLRRQIESGTLIGTHGTPFLSSSFSSHTSPPSSTTPPNLSSSNHIEKEKEKKRKRGSSQAEGGKGDMRGDTGKGEEEKIKQEEESDGFESMSEGWDSEDEVPLAKLRKVVSSPRPAQIVQPNSGPNYGVHGYGYSGEGGFAGGNGNVNRMGNGGGRAYEVQRYVPVSESRAWTGMIPVGNVGIESAYPAYWGGFNGVAAWEQDGKPRKSV